MPHIYDGQKNATRQDIMNRIARFRSLGYVVGVIECVDEKESEIKSGILDIDFFSRVYKDKSSKSKFIFSQSHGLIGEQFLRDICQVIDAFDPDVLWFEYARFAYIAKKIKKIYSLKKIIFRSHNYERGHFFEKWRENRKSSRKNASVMQLIRNYFVISRAEQIMIETADVIACISLLDMKKYVARFGDVSFIYLPFMGEYISVSVKKKKEINVVCLNSNLHNNVNAEGARVICEVARYLQGTDFKFFVTGAGFEALQQEYPFVTFTGFIDDYEAFMAQMDIAVIPNSIGYGMKVKAYESLMRGLPSIVSTRVHEVFAGAETQTYLVADQVPEWIVSLQYLKLYENRKKMSQAAVKFMKQYFSEKNFDSVIKQIV